MQLRDVLAAFGPSNGVAETVRGLSGWLYSKDIAWTIIVGLMISRGMMQIIAWVIEGRWLSVKDQYPSFWWGDLIIWPAVMIVCKLAVTIIANSSSYPSNYSQSVISHVIALVIGLSIGIAFRIGDAQHYSTSQLMSPTKLWHDFAIFTLFGYFVISVLPVIGRSILNPQLLTVSLVSFVLFGLLAGIFVYIQQTQDPLFIGRTKAHIDFDWWGLRSWLWLKG